MRPFRTLRAALVTALLLLGLLGNVADARYSLSVPEDPPPTLLH